MVIHTDIIFIHYSLLFNVQRTMLKNMKVGFNFLLQPVLQLKLGFVVELGFEFRPLCLQNRYSAA
jgi:hypothetical protein